MLRATCPILAALVLSVMQWGCDSATAAAPAARPGAVAVVELFTSQGCSSCPPAEEDLSRLNAAAVQDHLPIYTLAFHVDYWDHGGWRDRFSDSAFTARQSQYARLFHLDEVYTPQMIVNGLTEFVGSDSAKADRAIAAALAMPAAVPVSLTDMARQDDGSLRVRFAAPAAGAAGAGMVVNVAVVEQGLSTRVDGGENAGQHLDQPSVVRYFATVAATPAVGGECVISPLPAVRADRAAVVLYVQRTSDGAVLGAAAGPLPASK